MLEVLHSLLYPAGTSVILRHVFDAGKTNFFIPLVKTKEIKEIVSRALPGLVVISDKIR